MNNRFKFRVWDVVHKEYSYAPDRYYALRLDGMIVDGNGCSYDEHHIVQQYTGCVDATGKEIYEGDVVEYSNGGKHIGYVEFSAGIYFLTFPDQTEEELGYLMTNNLKVIGTMLESPEMFFANR